MKIFIPSNPPRRLSGQDKKRLEHKQQKHYHSWHLSHSHISKQSKSALKNIGRLNALQFVRSLISNFSLKSEASLSDWSLQIDTQYRRLERRLARTLKQLPPSEVKIIHDDFLVEQPGNYHPKKHSIVAVTLKKALKRLSQHA
ncbi:MAG TPA: hypothetical protein V6C52_07685 [Coleofasciculaceae cyanobacterium]|jgi:tRNA1(Val) A37 N6-methylase TrmN6